MKNKGQPAVSVTGRITMFLYLFTVLIMILYIQGSFQDFVDESLIMLLMIFKYSTIVFIAFAVSYIIILLIAGRNTGRKIISRIIITLAGLIISSIFFLAVEIIIAGLEPVL
ncbi:MAG TPA: hypothetical protein DCO79_17005 [Spirochaeta sp.]|nr:hypothetical protein [Spirochaeta sp.]